MSSSDLVYLQWFSSYTRIITWCIQCSCNSLFMTLQCSMLLTGSNPICIWPWWWIWCSYHCWEVCNTKSQGNNGNGIEPDFQVQLFFPFLFFLRSQNGNMVHDLSPIFAAWDDTSRHLKKCSMPQQG